MCKSGRERFVVSQNLSRAKLDIRDCFRIPTHRDKATVKGNSVLPGPQGRGTGGVRGCGLGKGARGFPLDGREERRVL